MPVLQLTPERVDHHHRQLGTPDPSSQYFLLHKPSQCSFPPAMFLSYQTYMFNLIKNPYILSTKNILKLLYIKKIYSAWLNEENYLFNIFFSNIHHQWIQSKQEAVSNILLQKTEDSVSDLCFTQLQSTLFRTYALDFSYQTVTTRILKSLLEKNMYNHTSLTL